MVDQHKRQFESPVSATTFRRARARPPGSGREGCKRKRQMDTSCPPDAVGLTAGYPIGATRLGGWLWAQDGGLLFRRDSPTFCHCGTRSRGERPSMPGSRNVVCASVGSGKRWGRRVGGELFGELLDDLSALPPWEPHGVIQDKIFRIIQVKRLDLSVLCKFSVWSQLGEVNLRQGAALDGPRLTFYVHVQLVFQNAGA